MSTRSAMNKRIQNREHTGVARRSASSAKPARAAATSVRAAPASSKARRKQREQGESLEGLSREERRARKRETRMQEDRIFDASTVLMKQDADYRRRRICFWVLIGATAAIFALTTVLVFALRTNPAVPLRVVQLGGMGVAYVIMIAAFIYDFVRLRPLRNLYRTQASGLSERKLIALLERAAHDEERKRPSRLRRKKRAAAEAKERETTS